MVHGHSLFVVLAIGLVLCALGQVSPQAAADHVTLTTPLGKIVIRLRTDAAPKSSAMFAKLASAGLYNGCTFYRAEDFCIQGGLRMANGMTRTNPFGHFPFEYGLPNKRGTVTLARWQDVNSATGEFFINLKDSPHLDRSGTSGWGLGFAVFGEIESGMDIVEKIAHLPTHSQGGMSMLATPMSFQADTLANAPVVAPHVNMIANAPPNMYVVIDGLGEVAVTLDVKNAPRMVAAVQGFATRGVSGSLHRAEAIPPANSQGPPYALVQASLSDPDGTLAKMPHEGSLAVVRGSVCVIQGTSEFFISLGIHPGWDKSMTVIGQVDSPTLERMVMPILARPHHSFKHPTFGIVMSLLDSPLPIHLSLAAVPAAPLTEEGRIQLAEANMAEIDREAADFTALIYDDRLRGVSRH